ncbi:hypothetical protein A3J61_01245 [Candidatus Nomurabacteria bacterium RIFCSPHIGHO2_02_FULL_38_15]|uniref:N-acetyltransferase domain-containing protein n=1 Tax=Candidatus Nomurabacteria bacterium RIFCSPHIGHO2_02_FULL_38_15 TaxID=1801752 RepID=A0A1F6VSN5_9BACT|nr:MAG: hypothetical protein A3J61_01245 [Candidatus Nomurabacteria bacterium RIFCSPHIGHO2_02_FULL_38_15]
MTRDEILAKQMKIAEEFFGTENDPDQMPINSESTKKLDTLCDCWLSSEFDEYGEPISWAIVMPTQKALAINFLNKKITERQLLELTMPSDIYDAIYFASVITVPEHRGKGLALKVVLKALEKMSVTKDVMYFTWPTTKEGESLLTKTQLFLGKEVKIRSQ